MTADIRVRDVLVTDDGLSVALMDGRTISVPLEHERHAARLARARSFGKSAPWFLAAGEAGRCSFLKKRTKKLFSVSASNDAPR